jgi:hypothetical protein
MLSFAVLASILIAAARCERAPWCALDYPRAEKQICGTMRLLARFSGNGRAVEVPAPK